MKKNSSVIPQEGPASEIKGSPEAGPITHIKGSAAGARRRENRRGRDFVTSTGEPGIKNCTLRATVPEAC